MSRRACARWYRSALRYSCETRSPAIASSPSTSSRISRRNSRERRRWSRSAARTGSAGPGGPDDELGELGGLGRLAGMGELDGPGEAGWSPGAGAVLEGGAVLGGGAASPAPLAGGMRHHLDGSGVRSLASRPHRGQLGFSPLEGAGAARAAWSAGPVLAVAPGMVANRRGTSTSTATRVPTAARASARYTSWMPAVIAARR